MCIRLPAAAVRGAERTFAETLMSANCPGAELAALLDHLIVTGEHLAAMVIQAARLAAILLRIARGLRPA